MVAVVEKRPDLVYVSELLDDVNTVLGVTDGYARCASPLLVAKLTVLLHETRQRLDGWCNEAEEEAATTEGDARVRAGR